MQTRCDKQTALAEIRHVRGGLKETPHETNAPKVKEEF